jgi:hypothetical protein
MPKRLISPATPCRVAFRTARIILSAGLLFSLLHTAAAQTVSVKEDPAVTQVMSRWKQYNLEHQEVQGWRVQIIATTDRRQMEAAQRKFELLYPEDELVFIHNVPYYQLKAGAFLYNRKAHAFLYKMQADFPGSILVSDLVKTEELLRYDQ